MSGKINVISIFLTAIFYILLCGVILKDIRMPQQEEGVLLFWVLIGLVSPIIWFFGRLWLPFVGQKITKSSMGEFANLFKTIGPFVIFGSHIFLIVIMIFAIISV